MVTLDVFIESLTLSESERIENYSKLCADIACSSIGSNYFWKYAYEMGTIRGLGKTAEKCFTKCMTDRGIRAKEGSSKGPIDTIDLDNRIGIQTKTTWGMESKINIGRIEIVKGITKDEILRNKIEFCKNNFIKEMRKHSLTELFIVVMDTMEKNCYVYHAASYKGGQFETYGTFLKESHTSYSEKQTPLSIKLDGLKLVLKKKHPAPEQLVFKTVELPKKRKDITKLSDKEQIEILSDSIDRSWKYIKNTICNYCLGEDFGDKGDMLQAFIIRDLESKYENIGVTAKGLADLYIDGTFSVQIKLDQTDSNTYIFCRDSKRYVGEDGFDHKKTEVLRKNNVNEKILNTFKETNTKQFMLLTYNGYYKCPKLYLLSELNKDKKSITNYGSFLQHGCYHSEGGKYGNQSHFRINKLGLRPLGVPSPYDVFFDLAH